MATMIAQTAATNRIVRVHRMNSNVTMADALHCDGVATAGQIASMVATNRLNCVQQYRADNIRSDARINDACESQVCAMARTIVAMAATRSIVKH